VFPLALLVIAGVALLIGITAALVPAFTVARQNVVRALSGRRGIVRSRKRWLLLGIVMIAAGGALGVLAARRASANLILTGLVLAELGAALCTPALVGLIAKVGRLLPLSPRIALRDAARNRASAAPAIAAVMAAVAGTVAMGVYLNSNSLRQSAGYELSLPVGTAFVANGRSDAWTAKQSETAEAALRRQLPVTKAVTVSALQCKDPGTPPATGGSAGVGQGGAAPIAAERTCYLGVEPVAAAAWRCPYNPGDILSEAQRRAAHKDDRCNGATSFSGFGAPGALVDDGSAIGLLTGVRGSDLDRAVATLKAGGVIVTSDHFLQPDGTVQVKVTRYSGAEPTSEMRSFKAALVPGGVGASRVIVSPAVVVALGGASVPFGVVASTGRMPSGAEIDKARASVTEAQPQAMFGVEQGASVRTDPRLWVLTGAAILVTIGAAAMATGLAAADGRADLSTLAAVGAAPRVRRILSLSQSGVIAGLGSVLGTLAGLGAAWAVLMGLNAQYASEWPVYLGDYPITAPWVRVVVGLVLAPAVAMAGAGLLVRSRLPIERRAT
jgi:putative ABC transport system permease protein